jgi:hypothetical protein
MRHATRNQFLAHRLDSISSRKRTSGSSKRARPWPEPRKRRILSRNAGVSPALSCKGAIDPHLSCEPVNASRSLFLYVPSFSFLSIA